MVNLHKINAAVSVIPACSSLTESAFILRKIEPPNYKVPKLDRRSNNSNLALSFW